MDLAKVSSDGVEQEATTRFEMTLMRDESMGDELDLPVLMGVAPAPELAGGMAGVRELALPRAHLPAYGTTSGKAGFGLLAINNAKSRQISIFS